MDVLKNADEYTYTHSINVAFYSMMLCKWLKKDDTFINCIIRASILHDIGKSKIPLEVLNKKGPFTSYEFDLMKKHTIYGYEIIKPFLWINTEIKNAVILHHERLDGSGYPFGLTSEKTPIYSRIIAISDVFDALTSDRVYKKMITPFEAFKYFTSNGLTQFDIRILSNFLSNMSRYYIGSKVRTNTGETGEIVFVPPQNITAPVIRLNNGYCDLSTESDLYITEMV